MKTNKNKFLTTIAAVCIALIALFTGCNKEGFNKHNGLDSDNNDFTTYQIHGGGSTSLVNLGTASTFAVLGGTTVTNAPAYASLLIGDAGVGTAGNALTGFSLTQNTIVGSGAVTDGAGIVTGTIYAGGDVAAQAHADALAAYTWLMAQTPDESSTIVTQLAGQTFTPGVYFFQSANLAVDGILTLDFQGNSDALFIFQTESTLVTMTNSQVVAINTGKIGPKDCLGSNVFWAVGSSATISGAEFIGTVIANTAITMTNSVDSVANVAGRLLALGAEVTIINATISTCGTSVGGKPGHTPKPCRDFVTGGGWINDKETFGVSGGIKNGKFWGQLSYNDHAGTKIKSTESIGYAYIDATTREIKYLVKVNGGISVDTVTVTVSDNGEPGRNDTFTLTVDGNTTTLTGGNIQLHKECGDQKDDEHHYSADEEKGNQRCDNDHRGGDRRN